MAYFKLSAKRYREIEQWAIEQLRKKASGKPYRFHTKFKYGMTAETYNALERHDRAVRSTKAYYERKACEYMTWYLGKSVSSCKWEGDRIRYVYAGGEKIEIPHWNAYSEGQR